MNFKRKPTFAPEQPKPVSAEKSMKDLEKILRESDERVRELFERQNSNNPCHPDESQKIASMVND